MEGMPSSEVGSMMNLNEFSAWLQRNENDMYMIVKG